MGPNDSFICECGIRNSECGMESGFYSAFRSPHSALELLPRPVIRPERVRDPLGDLVERGDPLAAQGVVFGVAVAGVERLAQRTRDLRDVGRTPLAALNPDRAHPGLLELRQDVEHIETRGLD